MRVHLGSIDVDDEQRLAIADFYGLRGLATREMVRDWYLGHAEADLKAMTSAFLEARRRRLARDVERQIERGVTGEDR